MHRGTSQHRAGTARAYIGAGRHQRDVIRGSVLAALTQAVVDGLKTSRLALPAGDDAVVHRLVAVFSSMVSHGRYLLP
jgi:hypothetical protein